MSKGSVTLDAVYCANVIVQQASADGHFLAVRDIEVYLVSF